MSIESRQICTSIEIEYAEKIIEMASKERRSSSSMTAILLIEAIAAREKREKFLSKKTTERA